MKLVESSPFGGRTRTRVLAALSLLETSFPRELARLLVAPVSGVRQALASLERDGLVAGRLVGKTHWVQLDPRYLAREELESYLARLAEAEPSPAGVEIDHGTTPDQRSSSGPLSKPSEKSEP